jgi:hypothetical protein
MGVCARHYRKEIGEHFGPLTHCSSLQLSIRPVHLAVKIGGIPHLAKNERDVGHPSSVRSQKVLVSQAEG